MVKALIAKKVISYDEMNRLEGDYVDDTFIHFLIGKLL